MKALVLIAGAAGLALIPAQARATDTLACGSTPAGTNIPNGAVFLSRGSGPVKAAIDAVGEYRTHSGISHGNGWYTHSTMFTPTMRDWDDSENSCGLAGDYCCQGPVKGYEMQNGYPGSSQITGGGLYKFYYQSGGPGSGASGTYGDVAYFSYQRTPGGGTTGAGVDVANWLWNNSNFAWVGSRQDGGQGFYRVGFSGVTPYAQYSLYQYRDYQGINAGADPWNHGDVCSTELAYAQHQAGKGDVNNNRSSGGVPGVPNSYYHTHVVNGLNGIRNTVESECSASIGFWKGAGVFLSCLGEGNICDDAGRQAANCFADGVNGNCYNDDDNKWKTVRDNYNPPGPRDAGGYSITKSVSPDNIGGWSGWGYGTAAPNSVWSWDGGQQVYWNSGGSVYGCFF